MPTCNPWATSRRIKLESQETLELTLPDGRTFYIKDSPAPFTGFQVFVADGPVSVSTGGDLNYPPICQYAEIVYIGDEIGG